MTDTLTPERRSALMSRIHGGLRTNAFERGVHGILKGARVRHRMYPDVKPSMDVRIDTTAGPLFVALDGCLWHVCPDHYRRPKTNEGFWVEHIEEAEKRRQQERARADFPFVVVWEHWWRDPVNRRDMVLGLVKAAARKVENGAVRRGRIEIDGNDLRAEWESWGK